MSKYDQEDLLDDLVAWCKSKLPQRLLDIEAEKVAKSKGVTGGLIAIPDAAYYVQAWDNAILQHTAAIYYGIEDVTARDIGAGSTATDLKIFFEIVLTDMNQYGDVHKRIARYSRALREIFEEYVKENSFISRTKIEQVRPISFKLELDTSEETNVGGVSISTSII